LHQLSEFITAQQAPILLAILWLTKRFLVIDLKRAKAVNRGFDAPFFIFFVERHGFKQSNSLLPAGLTCPC
jgi:hypothetical protein